MARRRFLLLHATLLAAGTLWFFVLRPAPASGLATAPVTVGDIEQTVLATGKLRPKELVSVGAQVSGQVTRLYVALGQFVRAGDPIAAIDAQPQQLALRNAEAAVQSLQGQKMSREGTLVQAELALSRQETMLAADATAHADYEAARATLLSLRGELRSLDAQLVQARTQVDTARINLAYTRIVAPMDGVIVAVVTKQGQTVNSFQSAPTIVMLAKLDVMTVRAEISEADVERVRPGQTVWFTTLGTPDRRHYARIERIEPAPESISAEASSAMAGSTGGTSAPTAIYYNALFDVENADGRLRPSMTAQVAVLMARAQRAVLIPLAALGPPDAQGNHSVRVIDASGRIEERKARTGISNDSSIVVLSGVRPGERVVIAEAAARAPDTGMGMGF